ncbi:hypothetical protein NQ317_010645 [Molorchus minor]|uniref:Uncharacterized protein n=1 Tax=Molorchus minor TaxID=1323400 RepID=A0ABQ9IR49_9CUCU|nr:hypothetical protein NQ317_010645 [Molorchus minor]
MFKKEELSKYCGTMSFSKYYLSLKGDVKSRYDAKIQLIDNVDPHSLGANELNRNLSLLPTVSIIDMVNYLIFTHSFYTGQQLKPLKAYKSLQAYKYYEAGFVKEVLAKKVHENAFVVVGTGFSETAIRLIGSIGLLNQSFVK